MKILIDRQSGAPLYQQVQAALKGMILEGVLRPGDELPASRILAKSLGLNRGTITAAYDELVADGLLHRHVGRGTYVSNREQLTPALASVKPAAPRPGGGPYRWNELFANDPLKDRDPMAAVMAHWTGRPGMISFAGGVPDMTLFPADEFRQAINRALKEEGAALLNYGTMSGYKPFIELLRHHLLDRGVRALPAEILIGNGPPHRIDLVTRTFVAPGAGIAV